MGTRNLTMVIANGETKVAQYGQGDGYPAGQGKTIIDFLKKADLKTFKEKVSKCKFLTEREIKKRYEDCGIKGDFMNMEEAARFKAANPQLNRDMAAEVLSEIYKGNTSELQDSSNFAADSLFCEYAYVVDLDKNKLEIYTGFNKKPLPKEERFSVMNEKIADRKEKYYPVKLAASYPLSKLPTVSQMEKDCGKDEN